jgi:2-succinyl-5-enolpyruvyl-6-hydroxy-3-cyclohexene-1-carboxylate synthase
MDHTNRNTALASALVEELARCGVRRAVIAPGSRSTPLALALWRQPAIEVTVLIDERSAGFFALGAGSASRVPAVVLCTSGTAAANLHPAVCEADEAGVPLIALTADRPPELRGIGAGQTIDQLKLYGDAVRWFCELGPDEADDEGLLHFRSVACRAYAAAAGDPRPGPVHLNVPWREPLAPTPVEGDVTATDPLALEGRRGRPLNAVVRGAAAPDPALLDELAERLAASPRGLILAGRQSDPALSEPVATLAAAAGYPILAEPTSQLRRGRHDLSLVVSAYDAIAYERPQALRPELVVQIGELPTSKALRSWLPGVDDLRQVVLDPQAEWKQPTRRAETFLRADPAAACLGLAERLKATAATPARAESDWAQSWLATDLAAKEASVSALAADEDLSEPGAWLALGEALRDGDVVLAASSMPVRDLESFLPPGREQVQFLANRGANGIDGLVSTAAGAAAATAAPDGTRRRFRPFAGERVWAVLGDLALVHDLGGLAAARQQPNLRLLVLDNSGGGIFHFLPQADELAPDEFERLLGTPSGIDLAAAVELFGLTAATPESPDELTAALAGDARVIVVRSDRAENLELHRRASAAAAEAVAAGLAAR